jgi:hypothetical protein
VSQNWITRTPIKIKSYVKVIWKLLYICRNFKFILPVPKDLKQLNHLKAYMTIRKERKVWRHQKVVIRRGTSKMDRQYNGQKKKDKRTNTIKQTNCLCYIFFNSKLMFTPRMKNMIDNTTWLPLWVKDNANSVYFSKKGYGI